MKTGCFDRLALQGISTIAGGYQASKSAGAQKLTAQIEGEMSRLRGTQIAERSREDLATMLGNINAIRTTRGASLDSPTGRAIERGTIQSAYRNEAAQTLAERMNSEASRQAARGFATQQRWAVPVSVLKSAGSFSDSYSYGRAYLDTRRSPDRVVI